MRKMNKKGLIGMLAAGAVAVSGAVCSLKEKGGDNNKYDNCGLALYVDTPQYRPEFVQKIADNVHIGIDGQTLKHPESGRVGFYEGVYPEGVRRGRETSLLSEECALEQDLRFLISETEISENSYQFSDLVIAGSDKNPRLFKEIDKKYPWFRKAANNGGYILRINKDKDGKVRELVYKLSDETVTVKDKDGDFKADSIEIKKIQ